MLFKGVFTLFLFLFNLEKLHCDITSDAVSKLFSEMMDYETLQKNYEKNGNNLEIQTYQISEAGDIAIKLLKKFKDYSDKFKDTASKAENILKTYTNTNLVNPGEVLWAREANESLCEFNNQECFEKSSVHIPIDIFREEKDIMETVTWTAALEPLWKSLFEYNVEFERFYFGSTTGVLRYFPGHVWPNRDKDKDEKEIDLYDVRRRSWYIEGMSTPKDVLILIDSSGSSQGQALALMKHMARQLLETFTENDFFNVLNFPQDSSTGKGPCFPAFVRATSRNKLKSLTFIKDIASLGIANFTRALENSFILFENISNVDSDNNLFGSHCNQMIMLLTDGGNEKPADLLRTHNRYLQIRIFTYLIGPISTNAPAIKWIAEKNRGKFYQIPSIVAIRSQTQDYIRFLADAKALSHSWMTMTTARYDQLSNNLVVSWVYPLYNTSHDSRPNNETIMGVLGMDVSIKKLFTNDDTLTYLNPNGYIFIVNFQGIAVYHPLYKQMLNDFIPVDIADLEPNSKILDIRKAMIDGKTGSVIVQEYDIANDEHHVIIRTKTFNYRPIEGLNLSIAVVSLSENAKRFSLKFLKFVDDMNWRELENANIFINTKLIESGDEDVNLTNLNILENNFDRIRNLDGGPDSLNEMFFNLMSSMSVENNWQDFLNTFYSHENYTDFMLLKSSNSWKFLTEKELDDAKDIMSEFNRFEERITNTDSWVVDVYNPKMKSYNNTIERFLISGRRLTCKNISLAIVAAIFSDQILRTTLFGSNPTPSSPTSSSYVLDDGGIIITTEDDEEQTGLFFGNNSVEPLIMKHMLENKIYKLRQTTRYFSSCLDIGTTDASSHITSFLSTLTFECIIPSLFSFFQGLFTIIRVIFSTLNDMVFAEVTFYVEEDDRLQEYCVKDLNKYSFAENAYVDQSYTITCHNCSKTYRTKMFKDVNLMLVVVDSHYINTGSEGDGVNNNPITDNNNDNHNNNANQTTMVRNICRCQLNDSQNLVFKPTLNLDEDRQTSSFEVNSIDSLCVPFSGMEELFSGSPVNQAASTLVIIILTIFITIINLVF